MKKLLLFIVLLQISGALKAQVLIMTISSLSSTPEGDLGRSMEGDWIFVKAEINGENMLDSFEGIVLTIPKCKKADRKTGSCPPVEVSGDTNTDYFKGLFGEGSEYTITSRKTVNKESKEDAIYEKVMYELITVGDSEVEYAFKSKKNTMYIETKSGDVTEVFELVHPPKEKKK